MNTNRHESLGHGNCNNGWGRSPGSEVVLRSEAVQSAVTRLRSASAWQADRSYSYSRTIRIHLVPIRGWVAAQKCR